MSTEGTSGSKGTTTYYNGGVEDREISTTSAGKATSGSGGKGTKGTGGSKGSKGTKGSDGTGGSKGSKGTDGSKGSKGTDGSKGSKGTDGSKGSKGTDGSKGSKGSKGTDGSKGSKGSKGTKGGPVDGTNKDDLMLPGYTDPQGDMIDGTDGIDDIIYAYDGDDTVEAGLGDDTVFGGRGNDVISGGEGNNLLDGGKGDDVFIGGAGADTFDGGAGQDNLDYSNSAAAVQVNLKTGTLTGGDAANDAIVSGIDGVIGSDFGDELTGFNHQGTDPADTFTNQFFGRGGDDTINGLGGDDYIDGGDDNDLIDGGDGDDTLLGGKGNDTIVGGKGNDSIDGGEGDDSITGGKGSDTINGGNGNNWIDSSNGIPRPDIGYPGLYPADTDPNDDRDLVTTGSGNDFIKTGDDADTISSGAGNDTINAGVDDDIIDAGRGDDEVTAGEGNDFVLGGSGNDTIYGGLGPSFPDAVNIADDGSDPFGPDKAPGNGKDTIDGGRGNDVIYGEDDDDLLLGGIGADTLFGGKDNDTIDGGSGQDDLIGGQGADSLFGGADRDEFFIDQREDAFGDTVDGGTTGNDIDRMDLRGLGRFEIVGETVDADGDSTSGTVNFLDADGKVEGTLIFREIEKLIVCFTPGTLIGTARGEVPVEKLREGDRVVTRDNGVQEIRWVGHKTVGQQELLAEPDKQPILVRKGSLGRGLPERDMLLSPNHRLLIANDQSALMFDEREVLAAAKHLVNGKGITQVQASQVTYIHFMFDNHEVVLSDGTWTESFQPGDYSLKGIEDSQREEIFSLFPELRDRDGLAAYGSARNTLKRHEAELLTF